MPAADQLSNTVVSTPTNVRARGWRGSAVGRAGAHQNVIEPLRMEDDHPRLPMDLSLCPAYLRSVVGICPPPAAQEGRETTHRGPLPGHVLPTFRLARRDEVRVGLAAHGPPALLGAVLSANALDPSKSFPREVDPRGPKGHRGSLRFVIQGEWKGRGSGNTLHRLSQEQFAGGQRAQRPRYPFVP